MRIEGSVALVTGANRGLGRSFTQALLDAGAVKVYAAARNPDSVEVTDPRLVPLALDVTDPASVLAAAAAAPDVQIVVNNAGVARSGDPLIGSGNIEGARVEMETNYFGVLNVAQGFAPVLSKNGGGALVNMLSVLSWFTTPGTASYSASKAAAWSLTNAIRVELHDQGTQVVAVHAGYIDTDMVAHLDVAKISPQSVASQTVAGIEAGELEVLADDLSRGVKSGLSGDLRGLYPVVA
jgi:NAD(P)-dependent dehydrogenase (short-subunit alcohol dehydrogenase family)